MSDFCTQCSIKLFGEDFGDMKLGHPIGLEGPLSYEWGHGVLCESCGPIIVDGTGKCIDRICKLHGEQIELM